MEAATHYLNTDLELSSAEELSAIATVFEAQGLLCLHLNCDEGLWQATFEANRDHLEPETSIAQMMTLIESLPPPLQALWANCHSRIFDIGYYCADQPWAFNQKLSSQILARIAAVNAAVQITLYPANHHNSAPS
jgi:hypothetical protein